MQRRNMIAGGAAAALLAARALAATEAPLRLDPGLPDGTRAEASLQTLPGKRPLIRLSERPPNYETPAADFRTLITPNDRFFVRYHENGIPTMAALNDWSLSIGGDAAGKPVRIGLHELYRLPTVELTAVCQCSGNRRGLFSPHVAGVEWGVGAMGNAVWRGARLADVLALAGVKPNAVEIWLRGADQPVLPATPPFQKSLPLAKAMQPDTIVAYAMNNDRLPHLNGFPVRLIVPGWTATYWVKHLTTLTVSPTPLDSFWIRTAYRVPAGMFPVDMPFATQADATSVPITEMVVNSLLTSVADGDRLPARGAVVRGIAWDRGHGIARAEVSVDGGASWRAAVLGEDRGRFSFRPFALRTGRLPPGPIVIVARAVSVSGETQAPTLKFNPAGYHNNVPRRVAATVA